MQEYYVQYQDIMARRSNIEEQCSQFRHSGFADRYNFLNLLSEEGYDPYVTDNLLLHFDDLLDFVDNPLTAKSNSSFEAVLKLAYEIEHLRLALLAEREATLMKLSKDTKDDPLWEKWKWCNDEIGVNSFLTKEKNKLAERVRAVQDGSTRKRRLCRHFLKGHCKRGNGCDFLHDVSIFCDDQQKVFLGGLPANITQKTLRERMAEQGFEIINSPKVFRGFTPQVCLGSVEQAQLLINKGRISIDGTDVDVRPYRPQNSANQDKKKLSDDANCSIFLGGLASGTTRHMIKDDLEKLGVKVVNNPLVKMGFSPQVRLGTPEQAQKVVQLKQVVVNNALVDVRPYINARRVIQESNKNLWFQN